MCTSAFYLPVYHLWLTELSGVKELYADQTPTGCGDVDCENLEEQNDGLTEGETETP